MAKYVYKLVTNDRELSEALNLRKKVFVKEQGVPENLELDEWDKDALHTVVIDGAKVIGTARILFPAAKLAKIERMAVLKTYRNKGVGGGILSFLYKQLKNRHVNQVIIHAQYRAIHFYTSHDFELASSPFWEAGIRHVKMQKQI